MRLAATLALTVALGGCAATPAARPSPSAPVSSAPASTRTALIESGDLADSMQCSPQRDGGCGTPDAQCATNRLGKWFTVDGMRYTCKAPKPYRWRR